MKYALLIYSDEAPDDGSSLSEAEQNAIMSEYFAISELPATFARRAASASRDRDHGTRRRRGAH